MKILIASTLKRRLSPYVTASRPSIIYQISKGMAKRGHEVSVLATEDSEVEGVNLIPIIPKAFVDMYPSENSDYMQASYWTQMVKKIEGISGEFDIIHNHSYPEIFNLMAKTKSPMVTTIHTQYTLELDNALALFPEAKLISISQAHMRGFKKAKFLKYVYNGIDTNLYKSIGQKEDYLLWLGRLSRAKDSTGNFMDPKGIRWAIELAEKTGEELVLSGNVEDMEFYEKDVKPHLNEKIRWAGPVSPEQALKREEVVSLMQKAKAFLMTVNWEEPFGLVMAEAMACGTPVIGFNKGSVSELVLSGKTGFVIDPEEGIEGLSKAVGRISEIDPNDCREHVVKNFSLEKMVENYEKVYKEVGDK